MNEMEEEEEMDDVGGLPAHCEKQTAPLRILGREARNWIKTWNACGTGRDRQNFRKRQWRKLRIIRADVLFIGYFLSKHPVPVGLIILFLLTANKISFQIKIIFVIMFALLSFCNKIKIFIETLFDNK